MWRLVLESISVADALEAIKAHGCGGACHMLIGDKSGSIGVEVTHRTIKYLQPDEKGRVFHSNHMLKSHPGTDMLWVKDSLSRVQRIRELADRLQGDVTQDALQQFLCDEENYPCSINREQQGESDAASVFSITMDLAKIEAKVLLGRPSNPDKVYILHPRPVN